MRTTAGIAALEPPRGDAGPRRVSSSASSLADYRPICASARHEPKSDGAQDPQPASPTLDILGRGAAATARLLLSFLPSTSPTASLSLPRLHPLFCARADSQHFRPEAEAKAKTGDRETSARSQTIAAVSSLRHQTSFTQMQPSQDLKI